MNRIDELTGTAPIPALAGAFSAAGRSLYLVGGPVRDALLGRRSTDLDFTTDAHPSEVKKLLQRAGADHIFAIGEKFGHTFELTDTELPGRDASTPDSSRVPGKHYED